MRKLPVNGNVVRAQWADGEEGLAYREGNQWFRWERLAWSAVLSPKNWSQVCLLEREAVVGMGVKPVAAAGRGLWRDCSRAILERRLPVPFYLRTQS